MSEKPEDVWLDRDHPIKENMSFQRANWIFERVSWCILYLIICLALLGFFSAGPLSSIRLADPGAQMQMDFERFHRNGALTDMVLYLRAPQEDTATVRFNTSFIEALTIEDIQPAPVLSHSDSDGISFVFDASKGDQMSVYISVRPMHLGMVPGSVSINGNEEISFSLFIYP